LKQWLEELYRYLGYDFTYTLDKDLRDKLSKYDRLGGVLRRKLQTKAQLKFYKVIALSAFLHGSDSWTIIKRTVQYRVNQDLCDKL
jgi:hypothetical protein